MSDENLAGLLREEDYKDVPEYIESLSLQQKKRVCALKKLQLSCIELETQFYERVHALEKEFESKFANYFEQRRKIVTGEHEPTDEEADMPLIHGLEDEELKKLYDASEKDNAPGIPDFWFTALRGSESINDMIQECDEPILKHLTDITATIDVEPPGFTLFFHFSENEYFSNKVLKKHYALNMKADPEDPFEYDGPSVIKATGDEIHWAEGKNVTKKVIKKKSKKGKNAGKFLTKTVDNESFFNFFNPPQIDPALHEHDDLDLEGESEYHSQLALRNGDFEIGQIIRDHIIPRAVLHYTGEANLDDDLMDFDEDEDEEDYSSDDQEEEEDEE